MLYDPKWDIQTKARPTLRDFIRWLRTKDANASYDWSDPRGCACAQFYRERGEYPDWIPANRKAREAEGVDINVLASQNGWTYGALLQRCQEALAE